MAGVARFEPTMAEPKSAALPLGYTPTVVKKSLGETHTAYLQLFIIAQRACPVKRTGEKMRKQQKRGAPVWDRGFSLVFQLFSGSDLLFRMYPIQYHQRSQA